MAATMSNITDAISETSSKILDRLYQLYEQMSKREIGHETVDRKTGKVVRERMPFTKKAWLQALYNPVMDTFDQTGAARHLLHDENIESGRTEASPKSKKYIRPFVEFHEIDMSQFIGEVDEFESFNDFFTRKLKPGARPITAPDDPKIATSAADCRLVVFNSVAESKKLWIKGKHFTMANLIDDAEKAKIWANSPVASFRLSPQDYHHYHSPVGGTVEWFKELDGTYYGVDPHVTNSKLDNLTSNARTAVCINSPEFGKVLFVPIGAEDVGTVKLCPEIKEGHVLKKGDEIGWFAYGGSNVIVAFEEGKIQWDEDLVEFSKKGLEANLKMGERVGCATSKREE